MKIMELVKCFGSGSLKSIEAEVNNFICTHAIDVIDVNYLRKDNSSLWNAMIRYKYSFMDDFVKKIRKVHNHLEYGYAKFDHYVKWTDQGETPNSDDIKKGMIICSDIKLDWVRNYNENNIVVTDELRDGRSGHLDHEWYWRHIQNQAYNAKGKLLIIRLADIRFMGMCDYLAKLGMWGAELTKKDGEKFVFDGYTLIYLDFDWDMAVAYAQEHNAAGYKEMMKYYDVY